MEKHLDTNETPQTAHGPGMDEFDEIAAREGDAIRRAFRPPRHQRELKASRGNSETGPTRKPE